MTATPRELWGLLEIFHALVYYAPERTERYRRLGLVGGWMGYFATRSAALGRVDPSVVTACFHGFAHPMVARALPDAWDRTTPELALEARYDVVDTALRRVLGGRAVAGPVRAVADRLGDVVEGLAPHGRPLFAAHAALPRRSEPHLALFRAATALREYRGDAHVVALQAAGISPVSSHVLMAGLGRVPDEQRRHRGWTQEEWDEAARDLVARGWLEADASATDAGRRARDEVELETDRLSAPAWSGLPEAEVAAAVAVLAPLVAAIVAAGEVPWPNGMGVAPGTPARTAGGATCA